MGWLSRALSSLPALALRIPEPYQLGLCLPRALLPPHFVGDKVYVLGKLAGGFEKPQSEGWLEQRAGSRLFASKDHSPLPSPCHMWSALADIDFSLCNAGPGTRSCQGRTTLPYPSLPMGLGSCCQPQAQQDSLRVISAQKWFGWTSYFNVSPTLLPSPSHLGWCQLRDLL